MADRGAPKRKLIEVALPLDAINREAAREKSIRHGHPSTLHLWWARRPLAACRAVLFAQLVDDPSAHPELFPTEEAQDAERQRLFGVIERLVPWEASNDEDILAEAREEIRRSCGEHPPPVLDPFCGGGSIPLEAQRLGLEANASDLNPVAVLITKALIELPARFAGRPPVRPNDGDGRLDVRTWKGAQGLAEDLRYYGAWMRDQAKARIGHLYPTAPLPGGGKATVIAWIWARTVTCPNPACGARMPLVRSFWLGKKKGKEAWVRPVVEGGSVRFEIGHGPRGPSVEGTVGRNGATCLVCVSPVPLAHIRAEGKAGRMGAQLMAIVAEGDRERIYLPPIPAHEQVAQVPRPEDVPDTELPAQALGFRVQGYGMTRHADLFTNRQLAALSTFSDLVREAGTRLIEDGADPAYADAVLTYLALGVSRLADIQNALCRWENTRSQVRNLFTRQAVSMLWDFAEGGLFSDAAGDFGVSLGSIAAVVEGLPYGQVGSAQQSEVTSSVPDTGVIVSTDPPYYDNVGYADLSDFFYVWLRRSIANIYPELFSTLLTPKAAELVADPFRTNGDKEKAERLFEESFEKAFSKLRQVAHPDYPLTVFYAFKQSEHDEGGVASTGWETMLAGLLRSGLAVTATWPMRTELGNRMRNQASNALASSIVLACRPRSADAGITDRRGFLASLHAELPKALRELQQGNIAPVDLAQAAIGPGMAVFSGYAKVVEANGDPMTVRTALALINQVLDEVLAEQEGEFDAATRFAIKWFEQYGFDETSYDPAEGLARATNVSVAGLEEAGILMARAGRVRLLPRENLPANWDPTTDKRVTVWEVTQQLVRAIDKDGEAKAADLLRKVGGLGYAARDLAYRLYSICERRGWAENALGYNLLVTSWPRVAGLAAGAVQPEQLELGQ
jgi:putative DNA methylase